MGLRWEKIAAVLLPAVVTLAQKLALVCIRFAGTPSPSGSNPKLLPPQK